MVMVHYALSTNHSIEVRGLILILEIFLISHETSELNEVFFKDIFQLRQSCTSENERFRVRKEKGVLFVCFVHCVYRRGVKW